MRKPNLSVVLVALSLVSSFAHAGGANLRNARKKAKQLATGWVTPGKNVIQRINLGSREVHFKDGDIGRYTTHVSEYYPSAGVRKEPDGIVEITSPNRRGTSLQGANTTRRFETYQGKVTYMGAQTAYKNGTRLSTLGQDRHGIEREGKGPSFPTSHQPRLANGRWGGNVPQPAQ